MFRTSNKQNKRPFERIEIIEEGEQTNQGLTMNNVQSNSQILYNDIDRGQYVQYENNNMRRSLGNTSLERFTVSEERNIEKPKMYRRSIASGHLQRQNVISDIRPKSYNTENIVVISDSEEAARDEDDNTKFNRAAANTNSLCVSEKVSPTPDNGYGISCKTSNENKNEGIIKQGVTNYNNDSRITESEMTTTFQQYNSFTPKTFVVNSGRSQDKRSFFKRSGAFGYCQNRPEVQSNVSNNVCSDFNNTLLGNTYMGRDTTSDFSNTIYFNSNVRPTNTYMGRDTSSDFRHMQEYKGINNIYFNSNVRPVYNNLSNCSTTTNISVERFYSPARQTDVISIATPVRKCYNIKARDGIRSAAKPIQYGRSSSAARDGIRSAAKPIQYGRSSSTARDGIRPAAKPIQYGRNSSTARVVIDCDLDQDDSDIEEVNDKICYPDQYHNSEFANMNDESDEPNVHITCSSDEESITFSEVNSAPLNSETHTVAYSYENETESQPNDNADITYSEQSYYDHVNFVNQLDLEDADSIDHSEENVESVDQNIDAKINALYKKVQEENTTRKLDTCSVSDDTDEDSMQTLAIDCSWKLHTRDKVHSRIGLQGCKFTNVEIIENWLSKCLFKNCDENVAYYLETMIGKNYSVDDYETESPMGDCLKDNEDFPDESEELCLRVSSDSEYDSDSEMVCLKKPKIGQSTV